MTRSKSEFTERHFIRHPSRMPIRFDLQGDAPRRREYLRNVGEGGLCFFTELALDPGLGIHLVIPVLGQQFEVDGAVAWRRPAQQGYEIGVRFLTAQDQFCVRMVEQLCYIEDYRRQVLQEEGRQLSSEQAAEEWISHFADRFPGLH